MLMISRFENGIDYEAENIFYVTMNPQHNLVREHIRLGGKAVIIEKVLMVT